MANKTRKKQSHSDRYLGYKDISPNNTVKIWEKDKNPVHSSRVASKELVDYDYLSKLTAKERRWLTQFTKEYYFNQFDKDKKPLHNKKAITELHSDNNHRRRCYELTDSQPLEFIDKSHKTSLEDTLIDWIDSKKTKP